MTKSKKALTTNQWRVLHFIESFILEKGFSPSLEEIRKAGNYASRNAAYKYVQVLEKKGWIKRRKNTARSIRIL